MPVVVHAAMRHTSQAEFARIAYDVMQEVFCVHREFGRLFDEEVYLQEVARRCGGQSKVPIEVTHAGFRKKYYMDLVVQGTAVFELKAVTALSQRHRQQLLNYLLLAEMSHGKLVNFHAASVEHEFVNTSLTLDERRQFQVEFSQWNDAAPAAETLRSICTDLVADLGSGLEVSLYEEALVHLLGGEAAVAQRLPVGTGDCQIVSQPVLVAAPRTAFRLTALDEVSRPRFKKQLQRLLDHLPLDFLHWINIYRNMITLTTLEHG